TVLVPSSICVALRRPPSNLVFIGETRSYLTGKHLHSCHCEFLSQFTTNHLLSWFLLLAYTCFSQLPKMPILEPLYGAIGNPHWAIGGNPKSFTHPVGKFLWRPRSTAGVTADSSRRFEWRRQP